MAKRTVIQFFTGYLAPFSYFKTSESLKYG